LLAVEAVKVQQLLHGVRAAAAEQSLREALGVIGSRLAARADGPITTLAISPDSRWVVTGSEDKTVRLWELRLGAKDLVANPVVLRGHDERVYADRSLGNACGPLVASAAFFWGWISAQREQSNRLAAQSGNQATANA
jgi:WD40 repeat protein